MNTATAPHLEDRFGFEPLSRVRSCVINLLAADQNYVIAAIAVIFVVWGGRLVDTSLSGDDWTFLFPGAGGAIDLNLHLGRWGAWLVHKLSGDASFAPFLSTFFAISSLAFMGLILAAVGALREWSAFTVIVMNGVSPLYIEFLNFEITHFPEGIGLIIAVVAAATLHLGRSWPRVGVISGLMLMVALSLYQPTAVAFGISWAGLIVFRTLREPLARGWLLHQIKVLATAGCTGVLSYLGTVNAFNQLTGTKDDIAARYNIAEGYVNSAASLFEAADKTAEFATGLFFSTSASIPIGAKAAVAILVLMGLLKWVRHLRHQTMSVVAISCVVVITILTIFASPLLLWLLRQEPVPRYNVVAPLSIGAAVFIAVLVALPSSRAQRQGTFNGRKLVARGTNFVTIALICGVIVTSAFQVSRAFNGQYLANQRDMALANRILWTVQSHPGYESLQNSVPVGVVGTFQPALNQRPFRFNTNSYPRSIVGCGVPRCQEQRLAHAMNLVGVTPFTFLSIGGDRLTDELGFEASEMPVWPAQGSVQIVDGAVVVRAG